MDKSLVSTEEITKKEIASWAMFDFANSSYVTVVSTAVFNAYFVGEVARSLGSGKATLYLTSLIAFSNLLVVLTAPVIGALADFTARKKRLLLATSIMLVIATILLGFVSPGAIWFGLVVLG
ncbi:MAG TPA: MFS transporter, partial [Candidatus Melainabacteria bacterium]|nr:MFS transporter [Candidatus Melainabacteria bacterium]